MSGDRPARGAGVFCSARSTSRASGRATSPAEADAARPTARSSSKVIAASSRRKAVAGSGEDKGASALFFFGGPSSVAVRPSTRDVLGAKRSCATTPSVRNDPSARSKGASPTWYVRAFGNETRDSNTSVPARKRTSADRFRFRFRLRRRLSSGVFFPPRAHATPSRAGRRRREGARGVRRETPRWRRARSVAVAWDRAPG